MRFAVLVCLLASALVASAMVQPFKQGKTYTYRLRTQVSSALLASEPSMIQQQAATGMQAQLKLTFTNDHHARVQLQHVRLGEMNGQVQGGQQQMIPTEMFEKRQMPEEVKQQLETPFSVQLVDGVVERLNFQDDEETSWSKNVKRAVVNMLQLNLKRNDVQGLMKESSQPRDEQKQRQLSVFSIPEITLEGECETHYSIQRRNSQYGQSEEEEETRENEQLQPFNVTKTINFNKCQKTADVHYGFQPNPAQQMICHKCLKQTEIKSQAVGKSEKQEHLKLSQCQQECQTNQLTNNKNIERSTVAQFELHGNAQKYGIRRSKVISQYIVNGQNPEAQNTISQVVAISELVREQQEDSSAVPTTKQSGKDETLMYNPEWDLMEKRFYQYGDEQFQKSSPFAKTQKKAERVAGFAKEILKQWAENKEMGYELNSAILFNKLVQIVRQSSVPELKQIEQSIQDAAAQLESKERESVVEHAKTLFLDTLAVAATRNTIHVLAHKIKQQEVSTMKAAQLIKIFSANQHSPSDRQADILEQIATSEPAQKCPILKQTAWFAHASAIGKICQVRPGQSQNDKFRVEELCPHAKKEQYAKNLVVQWKDANTVYEQILALKLIGNAALDKTMPELEKIITDRRQPVLIRLEAIDALRRLRTNMPEKIQQILLPLFQNQRTQPELRMAAASMILYTQPSAVILDQIVFTIQNDRSQNVKSFVLTALDSLSKSPNSAEKQVAQHLKAALKIVKITPEQMRASRKYHRIPIYVSEQENTEEQNIFIGLASIVSPSNMLPIHLSTSLQSAFNGDATKEHIQLSFTQKDLEHLYEKLTNAYERFQDDESDDKSGERQSAKDLRKIYTSLGIKSRRTGSYYLSSEESEESGEAKRSSKMGSNRPFGMIVLRTNDQDQMLIPIDEQKFPQLIRKFLNGEKPALDLESYSGLRSQLSEGKHFQQHIALNLGETKVKIPTTAGLPLAIVWQTSIVASVQGRVQAELDIPQQKVQAELRLRSSIIATHQHKTEVWTPALVSGVKTWRTVELNHGELKMKISANRNEIKITIQPPKNEQKERVLGLHTLPATYTQKFEWESRTYGEPRLRTVRNYALESSQVEYHAAQQHRAIRVEGNVHYVPLNQLITALYTTENNVHVYFKQGQETPEEVSIRIQGFAFRRSEQGEHQKPDFSDFFKGNSKRKEFRSIYEDQEDEQEYKPMELQNNDDRESRYNKFADEYSTNKAYKHQLRIELEARTPTKTHKAEVQMQGQCDQRLQHCKAILNAQRTPMFAEEQENWQLQAKVQVVLPESIRDEENPEEKQSRMLVKADAEWGSSTNGQENTVHLRLQGEPTRKTYWRSEVSDKHSRFLNKFDLVVDYQLERPQRHAVQRVHELIKAHYFWQLQVQPERKGEQNTVRASLIIDPIGRRTANLTIQTPQERLRAQSIELPIRIQGFSLERRLTNYHSFGQMIQSYSQGGSSECRADERRVRTFDGVAYRAPMSSCWTVLAKDCSREDSRFVVLMKKSADENEKKIKIITRENTIELQKEAGKQQVSVKVDGKKVTDEEELSEYGIDKSDYQVYVQQRGISVRFDGEEASIKVSGIYKNTQCGLCGHYSNEEQDVFRTSDNKRSQSLKDFHKSYTLKNEECEEQKLNKFYQDRSSEEFRVKPRKQQSAYYRDSFQQPEDEESDERDNQFWSSSEEENSKENKKNKPVDRTQVLEYAQKVCFSMNPVKKCPQGSVPDDSADTKSVKTQFFCLERSSTQARRLQRQVRQGKVVESEGQKPSFYDNVEQPTKCQQAEFY